MIEGILGRGFHARCKSLIELTKKRIDVIRRKRSATEKFLKKDIADLLANGLDINAYGRAEGLLIELTHSSRYLYVELCYQFLLKQLSLMQKVSDFPENCWETVSSLICAAARFSDLPELRELREALQERYGTSLDHFVNRELAERMEHKPSTMENKVKLMQDIALEFSVSWDAKVFQQRMSTRHAAMLEVSEERSGFTNNPFEGISRERDHSKRDSKGDPAVMCFKSECDGTTPCHAFETKAAQMVEREEAEKGLQVLFDDEQEQIDEEERIIDRLLMHYCKKPSTYEPERLMTKGRSHRDPAHETALPMFIPEVQFPPPSISLPNERTAETETPANTRGCRSMMIWLLY